MKTVKTKKGTELPLLELRGKSYLQVAHRLQWLTEDVENYTIETVTTKSTDDMATVMAKISIYSTDGKLVKSATARKTEHKTQFGDFEEKAETGAVGRALAMLGFGTQHAVADLDEGTRIVDSPVTNVKEEKKVSPKSNGAAKSETKPTVAAGDDW